LNGIIVFGSFLTGSLNLPIPIKSPASLYNPIDVINTGFSDAFSEYAPSYVEFVVDTNSFALAIQTIF